MIARERLLKKIENFKEMISDPDTKDELLGMPENQQKKCKFALLKIQKAIEQMLKKME